MKKVLIIILTFTSSALFGVDIYLANWNVYTDVPGLEINRNEEDFSTAFASELANEDFGGLVALRNIASFAGYKTVITRSSLDASEICEQLAIDCLLYGSLKKSEEYYDAELKVYDNQKKEVRKVIYGKAGKDELKELARILAQKTAAYLKALLGIESRVKTRKTAFHGLYAQGGAGCWLPIGNWGEFLTGIFTVEAGVNLVPTLITPEGKWGNYFLRYGLLLDYQLGISKPGYEESVLHAIVLRVPIEVFWEPAIQHVFKVGIAPLFQLNLMGQNPLYEDGRVTFTTAFGLSFPLGYEYWLTAQRTLAIGAATGLDIVFYENTLLIPRLQIYTNWRLNTAKEKEGK
jgi:hypothetical protein